jgi:glycosyltransferase involved in cell wall biosynthesis
MDVLFCYRYQASRVHEIICQANILAEQGLSVGVVETGIDSRPEAGTFDPRVMRLVTRSYWEADRLPSNYLIRWKQHNGYQKFLRTVIAQYRPKVIVALDIDSSLSVVQLAHGLQTCVIFHFSEMPDLRLPQSIFRRWKTRQVLRRSRFAHIIVHPDPYRAAIFQADTGQLRTMLMIPNCPRLVKIVSSSTLKQQIETQLGHTCRLVIYIGAIAPGRGLFQTLESMHKWPNDTVLVCRGFINREYARSFLRRAAELSLANRVVIKEVPSYESDQIVAGHLATAEVGLALHEPNDLNQLYSGFASNKIHQYMSAGIPVIARAGPGFNELVEMAETGECVNMNSPESLGQAVTRLLSDDTRRLRLGQNGRRLHLTRFNYELCFAPLRDRILAWCEKTPVT